MNSDEFNTIIKKCGIMLFTDHIDFLPFIAESAKYRTYKFEYKDDYADAINFINEHKTTFVFNKNNKIVIGMLK